MQVHDPYDRYNAIVAINNILLLKSNFCRVFLNEFSEIANFLEIKYTQTKVALRQFRKSANANILTMQ